MPSEISTPRTILEKQLQKIEAQIRELKDRLPAHSIKPVMMMELLELENERDDILAQLQTLAEQNTK
ncbi:MAG: histidine kinase [Thermodesulfobacteriota bacterium]